MAVDKDQKITPEYRERVAGEYADGYPTEETLAEFLEAHLNGGEAAIKALLAKRRGILDETESRSQTHSSGFAVESTESIESSGNGE